LIETGREIEDSKRPLGSSEDGFDYVRVVEIPHLARASVHVSDRKSATCALIEKRPKDRPGVKSWQTTPNDRSVPVHQCGELAVAEDGQIFKQHGAKSTGWRLVDPPEVG
jgi:hypothetical protein